MAYELITDWTSYQAAVDRLLGLAKHEIRIYDEDLHSLGLESPERIEKLQSFLKDARPDALRIALRKGEGLSLHSPRLAKLLLHFQHVSAAQQTPEQLAHLRDAIFIVDGCHALVRFDKAQARSKLLIDEIDQTQPYLHRFHEIWSEGGTPIGGSTLGL